MSILDVERMKKDREAALFEVRAEHFFKTWAPQDREDAARFHAELFALIRQVYHDAQDPMMKYIHALVATLPMPIIQPEKQ